METIDLNIKLLKNRLKRNLRKNYPHAKAEYIAEKVDCHLQMAAGNINDLLTELLLDMIIEDFQTPTRYNPKTKEIEFYRKEE